MKLFYSILIVFIAAFCAKAIPAQTLQQQPLITVIGSAEVKVTPDEAVFELEVETLDKDLQKSKLLNDQLLKKLLEAIKPLVSDPRLIQTGYINLNPQYQFVTGKERLFLGYEVKRDVSVVLRDLSRFDELLSEIVKAGITSVNDVQLRTTQLRQHKDKARAMAVKAAQEKAAAMAAEIGQTIGKAVVITEHAEGGRFMVPQNMMSNASTTGGGSSTDSDSLFAGGLITVKATITVSFELK
ncbi:MAG: SIMPL domain-containing protein [Acidobacteriota bacterium]